MTVDEASGPPVEVWPDNLATVNTFVAMATQWRIGFAGPTGLDYTALPAVLGFVGVASGDWPVVFDGLRTMEEAALDVMHKKRKA